LAAKSSSLSTVVAVLALLGLMSCATPITDPNALAKFDDALLRSSVIIACHPPPRDAIDAEYLSEQEEDAIGRAAFELLWRQLDRANPGHHEQNGEDAEAMFRRRMEDGFRDAEQRIMEEGCTALETALGLRHATPEELARDVVPALDDAVLGDVRLATPAEMVRFANAKGPSAGQRFIWPTLRLSIFTRSFSSMFDPRQHRPCSTIVRLAIPLTISSRCPTSCAGTRRQRRCSRKDRSRPESGPATPRI